MGDELAADPSLVAGKRVLELGSGCGLCGFLATKLGAQDVSFGAFEFEHLSLLLVSGSANFVHQKWLVICC